MFDMKAEIGLSAAPDGSKKIVVLYPEDKQVIEWRRKKKVMQTDLGRGNFELEPSKSEAADLAFVNVIRVDKEDGPVLDESEALYVIQRLLEAEVHKRPERDGSAFTLRMKIARKLMTSHTLRIPSVKEMMDYERMRSSIRFGKYGQQEIRLNWQASAELYDKLKLSVDGYANDVPVAHKAEAISVLLQEIRADQEEAPESDDESD